jgi:hypothetical protein
MSLPTRQILFVLCVAISVAFQSNTCLAFSPVAIQAGHTFERPSLALWSSEESNEGPEEKNASSPPPPRAPPVVPQKRMDPLMASLTRMNPETANGPTRKIPIFGEVPVDGSLVVLVPAALIGVLGFILSIVVAVQNTDQIVDSLNSVADELSQTATSKVNKVYDESVCRGLCSSQESDLEGLRSFMESLRKD